MPRTVFGQSALGLILQKGWTIKYADDGTLAGTATFRCDADAVEALLPVRGTPHPKNGKLLSYESEGEVGENGVASVHVSYLGLTRDPSEPRISFMPAMDSDPIETHKNFASAIGGTKLSPLNGAKFDDDGYFVGFPQDAASAAAKLTGVTSYLRPGLVFRSTFFTANPALYELKNAGTRSTAPMGFPSDVTLPTGCEWLRLAPVMEQYGLIYKITQDYQLSGPNGVNKLIYSDEE